MKLCNFVIMQRILLSSISLIFSLATFAQPSNDDCSNATVLCGNILSTGNNALATVDACPGCSDGADVNGNFCFALDNTIWFQFTTNSSGGDAQIDFSNLSFNTTNGFDTELQAVLIEAGTPCDESTYSAVSNCESQGATNFSLTATGLSANTTYYILVDGDNSGTGVTNPAEASFDIMVSGTSVDQTPPSITIDTPSNSVCIGETVTFTADTSGCNNSSSSVEWYINGTLAQSADSTSFSTSGLTDGDEVSAIFVCESTSSSCPNSGNSNIETISVDDPSAYAGEDVVIALGESTSLEGSGDGTMSWGPSEGLSTTTGSTTIASPEVTTTYQLTVTSPQGCESTDDVTVVVNDPITVPNTFTPNDDGYNDKWVIQNIDNYPSAKVSIYDRWGQRIFNEVGYTTEKQWDGTFNGLRLPSGVYFYVIDLNIGGDNDIYQGSLTIVH